MALYEARRRILDTENGLMLDRGAVVKTDEIAWVERFGPLLRRISAAPSGIDPVTIEGTEEQKARGPVKKAEEFVDEPEDPPPAMRKPLVSKLAKRTENKVIDSDESEIKFDE